ncbi:CBS and ACT domain-containing protein [Brevibacillus laterosporus]|uniref:CBS and ACT domain-containing protein n=1 Tax=Brevibacillus laterosporus TaxID=1465 RepID=UPI00264C7939|nr:CBS and ACT domain-containing protein [Brevibacillus laterosporus]MDN9011256.1 CBS and ACT domain-containing protein [Brevibacillus laterosporus]MDO0942279.1 CBS and ACT domain-containing protein [Brevibacillus laterosporus]
MRLEDFMRKQVVTATATTSIGEALTLLKQNRIRHLPVLDNQILVGIVSDRDLRDALPSSLYARADDHIIMTKPVQEIMNTEVITAHPLDFLEEAAKTMYEYKVGSLPVLEENKLVGIVTESDILYKMIELFGVNKASSQIEIEVEDRYGVLAEVSQVIRESKVNVSSVIVFPSGTEGKKNLVFRVTTMDTRTVTSMLRAKGFHVLAPIRGEFLRD